MLVRHRHWLLRLLPLRLVVNNTQLYDLREKTPVLIQSRDPQICLYITNGFHRSKEICFQNENRTFFFSAAAFADNIQTGAILLTSLAFFAASVASGNRWWLLPANLPIILFLILFYVKRKSFIRLQLLH